MADSFTLSDLQNAQVGGSFTLSDLQADRRPAAVKAGGMINEVPRQFGLAARYGLEGLATTAQLVTEPLRYLQDRATGMPSKPLGMVASQFADRIGLPTPQGANERVIGDAARLVAGAGGVVGAAGAATRLPGIAGTAAKFLGANPVQQLAAAAGGGAAGGASREAGGGTGEQIGATVLGTVLGGMTASGVGGVVNRINAMRASPMQFEGKVTLALQENGVDFAALPAAVRETLLKDVKKAMNAGGELNSDALRRLADFRATGATPTRGMLTLDPVQLTREKNLAKIGANTADEGLQGLAQVQNQNNSRLIGNMNTLGAGNGSVDEAGNAVVGAITGRQSALRGAEQSAWDAARNSPGYKQPISAGVLSDINKALDEEGLMPFMSKEISNYMGAFQSGQRPFTPQDYRNLQSMLAREAKAGGNSGYTAGVAQRILQSGADVAPLPPMPPGMTTAGQAATLQADAAAAQAARDSLAGVNQARGATRAAYAYEDSSPLVRSVLSDGATSDPARIAQRFVIGGTPTEAATLAGEVGPTGIPVIKNAILAHLKSKAVSGAADEVANFSQSSFNKALREVGTEKLRLFFSPEEIAALQANGRVASYMQVQPAGSAVNNSNSGALMLGGAYDWLNAVAGKIPFGKQAIVDPLRSIDISLSQRQAQNLRPALVQGSARQPMPSLLGTGVAIGGLLSGPGVERP